MNIEGTGPQWFPDPKVEVAPVRSTSPGTVVGWLIFSLLLLLVLVLGYIRFYMKKSISDVCGEVWAYLVAKFVVFLAFFRLSY